MADTNRSSQSRRLARQWVGLCQSSHSMCKQIQTTEPWVPSRLLECESPVSASCRVRLVEKRQLHDDLNYIALSHCWGTTPMYTLSADTEQRLREGITLDLLPRTFREAFEVCGWFDIRYLWIDSLCIKQDSTADWAQESYSMMEVYSNAVLTIAAGNAIDSSKGLFRHRKPESIIVPEIKLSWENLPQGDYCIVDGWLWYRDVDHAQLATRAWAVQERFLSPRVLFFGAQQMFFECNCVRLCESFPSGPPPQVIGAFPEKLGKLNVKPIDVWRSAARVYSQANLTKETDKLIAISGIAKKLQDQLGGHYVAGMWIQKLEEQLIWWNPDARKRRPLRYRAPSWSWLSLDEKIDMLNLADYGPEKHLLLKVMHTHHTLRDEGQPTGDISSAVMCLRGKLKSAQWSFDYKYSKSDFRRYHIKPDCPCPERSKEINDLFMHVDSVPTAAMLGSKVYTLPVLAVGGRKATDTSRIFGLALMRTRKRRQEYVRIGRFMCSIGIGQQLMSHSCASTARSTVEPFQSEQDLLGGAVSRQQRIRDVFGPIVAQFRRTVLSQITTVTMAAIERDQGSECPKAFRVSEDEEEEVVRLAREEAEEEWRVFEGFDRFGQGYLSANMEAIPSQVISIV